MVSRYQISTCKKFARGVSVRWKLPSAKYEDKFTPVNCCLEFFFWIKLHMMHRGPFWLCCSWLQIVLVHQFSPLKMNESGWMNGFVLQALFAEKSFIWHLAFQKTITVWKHLVFISHKTLIFRSKIPPAAPAWPLTSQSCGGKRQVEAEGQRKWNGTMDSDSEAPVSENSD